MYNEIRTAAPPISPVTAAAVASTAWLLPAAMSIGANPSPTNPSVLLWYRGLRQPAWKPPDAAIPVVWAALQTGLAIAGYRLLRAEPSAARRRALVALGGCVGMIGGWSRLFFKRRNLPLCIAAAGGMAALGVVYTAAAVEVDKPAAAVGVPFTAWVGFAAVLTWSIWRLNR